MSEGKEIKGILHLGDESDEFVKKVKKRKEESLGIKLRIDGELDRVELPLEDKEGCHIGTLAFDLDEFKKLINSSDVLSEPSLDDIPKEEEFSEEEKKQIQKECEEDAKEMEKNPVSKEIEKYHK